ncbi:hypothetical protein ACVWZ3_007842 [Bradyrhizobium sp. i1.3.6]
MVRSSACFFVTASWRRRLSAICSPMVSTGLSEVIGSWKMKPISLALISSS